jgi:hypothetical protein
MRPMTKLTIALTAALAMAGGFAGLAAPASAQTSTTSEITVFGSDPCPRSTSGEIYVCNRRPEAERYRLPKSQQLQGTRQQRQSWANKSRPLTTVGNTGTGSCSAVGPGGHTGCLIQEINQNRREVYEQTQTDQAPR